MRREMLYVYAVYQERSFTKAAEKLHISQPALSAMVKKAERTSQTPIFDRNTTPISLTKAGECYIHYAEKIMTLQREMEDRLRMMAEEFSGELRLGGSAFFCSYIFPPLVKGFQKFYPQIHALWMEGRNVELADKLQHGELDFFLEVDRIQKKKLASRLWGKEQIILAVPTSFPVNQKLEAFAFTAEDVHDKKRIDPGIPPLHMDAFKDQEFIFLREGNDSYARGLQICAKAGFFPRIAMKVDSLMTSYLLASEEHGIAFIRDSILFHADPTDKLLFYKIDDPLAERDIHLYYLQKHERTFIASAFLKYLDRIKNS